MKNGASHGAEVALEKRNGDSKLTRFGNGF